MIKFLLPLFLIIGLADCSLGISQEQRQEYLNLARYYEDKAEATQTEADRCWGVYQSILTSNNSVGYITTMTENLYPNCERLDKQAAEYRDQANLYYELASD